MGVQKAWARALATAAKSLGIVGETYRDVGDGYAVFAGEDSPLNFSYGDYYPASVETLAGFYEGRASSWFATPAQSERAVNSIIAAGGRALCWETVLYRSLGETLSLTPSEDVEISTLEELAPWDSLTVKGVHGGWSDDPPDEAYHVVAAMEGVRRYVVRREGEAVGAATLFINDRIALLESLALPDDGWEVEMERKLLARLILDASAEADVAYFQTNEPSLASAAERLGFKIACSQLVFEIPTRAPATPVG